MHRALIGGATGREGAHLVDYLAAGDPLERFLDHFPSVAREQAVAALEIAGDLLAARAHPAR